MKKLITTLSIIALSPLALNAQNKVDIEVALLSPPPNFTYQKGDDISLKLILKSNSNNIVSPSDSIAIRIWDQHGQILTLKDANGKITWRVGLKAKLLQKGDTMHINHTIKYNSLGIPHFFNGQICIDAYPCRDSIGTYANSVGTFNIDSFFNNNEKCITATTVTTSIKSINSLTEATIQPNPASSHATINIKLNQPQKISVIITDMSGRIAQTIEPTLYSTGSNNIKINTQQLPTANYIVTLQDNNRTALWSTKLIKQ